MSGSISEVRRTARTALATGTGPTTQPKRTAPDAPVTVTRKVELPATILRSLTEGRLIKKSDGPEGSEPLISAHEDKRLVGLLPSVPEDALDSIVKLLREAETPTHRALLLRAVHARLERLLRRPEGALDEIERYGSKLHGLSAQESRAKSTVLDLDSTKNDSSFDPLGLAERRGIVLARGEGDRSADNDGLFQRFTASCGPTVVQMLAAEADPAFALELREAGLLDPGARDRVAAFQRRVLEQMGGVAQGNVAATLRARIHNGLGRARASDTIGDAQIDALNQHLDGARIDPKARAALVALRKIYDGFPTAAEVATVRSNPAKLDRGIDGDAFTAALTEHVSQRSGVHYQMTNPPSGFTRGRAGRHLDAVVRALKQGIDIPFGISEPSHWMALTGVRGRKPNRELLVSDPLGGRTAWVSEKDFVKGTFCAKPFLLCTGSQRGYVDCFFLPVR